MVGSNRSAVYGVYAQSYALPAGVTLKIEPMASQIGLIFKYISGGSLSVVNGFSSSISASYVFGHQYLLGTGEIQNLALSGPLYLVATGATCVFHVERLLSEPTV